MKKFTKIIICLLLCVVSLAFVACGNGDKNKKNYVFPTSGAVSGNDGLAVKYGDYVYFVNGMKTVESMASKKDSYKVGSLMIMKLDSNGQIIRDEEELIKDETYTTISDRLCGFEATGLFISGGYLYFTTPCLEDEGKNAQNQQWAKDRVEFYRIKLDCSTEMERVYQSSVSYENLKFNYYEVEGQTFILVYEQGESKDGKGSNVLVHVNASAKTNSVIATNVTSVTLDAEYSKICYVKNSNGKYELCGYNLLSNTTEADKYSSTTQFSVMKSTANKVFIEDGTDLYVSEYSVCDFDTIQTITGVDKYGDSMYVSEDGEYLIGINGTKIEVTSTDGNMDEVKINIEGAESLTFIGLENGCVVFADNNNNIMSVSYYDAMENNNKTVSHIAKVENLNTTYFDIDGTYVYFYKTVDEVDYLHRVDLTNEYVEEQVVEELFGVK